MTTMNNYETESCRGGVVYTTADIEGPNLNGFWTLTESFEGGEWLGAYEFEWEGYL